MEDHIIIALRERERESEYCFHGKKQREELSPDYMQIEENKTNNLSNSHENKFCNNMLSNIVIQHVNKKKMKWRCYRGRNMKFPCFYFSNNFSIHLPFETPSRPRHFYRLLTWNQSCHSLKTHCKRDINMNIYICKRFLSFCFFISPILLFIVFSRLYPLCQLLLMNE